MNIKKLPLGVKVGALCFLFSILGYICGCFIHSQFFHFFENLFGFIGAFL